MRILLLALLVLVTGCGGCAPTFDPKSAALRLEFTGGKVCSGSAIGPDKVLTAKHCVDAPLATVNGQAVKVISTELGDEDTAVVKVSGVKFAHWARMGKAKEGDHVRYWGNPSGGWPLMYREGHVSSVNEMGVVIDVTACHGDSGAGVFNDAGQIVGVVSRVSNELGCTFMLAVRA